MNESINNEIFSLIVDSIEKKDEDTLREIKFMFQQKGKGELFRQLFKEASDRVFASRRYDNQAPKHSSR